MDLTPEILQKIMPRCGAERATRFAPHLRAAMTKHGIDTPRRAAAFLAQLAHESGDLRWMEEHADGSAYEGRKDLGNVRPGDGPRYKGRGPIQLTGRRNYREYGEALGVDLENHPERAADPDVGFETAALYWRRNGCNELADAERFRDVSIKINGINRKTGQPNGLEHRIACWERAKIMLGA